MKAIIRTKGGKNLSTLQVQNIDSPKPLANQVKVKMTSSRINPVDVDLMKGMPFLKYKKPQIGGIDGAGEIIELGASVNNFAVGDKVFFYRKFTDIGTWAEEITINSEDIAKIPSNISVEQAGSIALPLLTAYDALQQLEAKAGEKILIHGAGGGVGFMAVQVAKLMGLEVIATGSERDEDVLKKAGVSKMINYKTQSFETEIKQGELDYIFDVIGKEVLIKSLQLQPTKVVSVAYVDTSKMYKTGIKLPGILKGIMKLTMRKFSKMAKKNNVEIIGQVTGADGKLLQEVSNRVSQMDFKVRDYRRLALSDIEKNGMSKNDFGKIIIFQS